MASSSHRRCQYRGEGCMGTAHAGHDQCAHCYFQFIKPAIAAERAEMKRRKELRLSDKNRALITETDLWAPPERTPPLSIERAVSSVIRDTKIEAVIDQAIESDDPNKVLGDFLTKTILDDVPTFVEIVLPKEELKSPMPAPPTTTDGRKTPTRHVPMTDATRQEIIDAYQAGMVTDEIRAAWRVGMPTLYRILREANVPMRGTGYAARKEPALPQSTPTVSAPAVEPPPTNGMVSVSTLTEWVVTYQEWVVTTRTEIVAARSLIGAARAFDETHSERDANGVSPIVISVARKESD